MVVASKMFVVSSTAPMLSRECDGDMERLKEYFKM